MLTLPTLTPQQITALLTQPRKRTNKAREYGLTAGFDYVPNPTSSQKGGFVGKSGTIHRTRKGATRRNSNGRRYYVVSLDGTLTAYMPSRVVK